MAFGMIRITNGPCMEFTKDMFELIVAHCSLALLGLGLEERTRLGVRVKAPGHAQSYEP